MTTSTCTEPGIPSYLAAKEVRACGRSYNKPRILAFLRNVRVEGREIKVSERAFPFPPDRLEYTNLDYSISVKSLCPETLQVAVLQLFRWCHL